MPSTIGCHPYTNETMKLFMRRFSGPLSLTVDLYPTVRFSWSGNLPMNVSRPAAGTVSGEYRDTAIHVLNLALGNKF
jgi:hypothetical protein